MKHILIENSLSPWYKTFREIYSYSFPIHEQRTEEQQAKAFAASQYRLEITIDKENLLSFISYWEFDSYIYIEHLAVNRNFRGNNIGSTLLQDFTHAHTKTVLLEIDPLTDEVARKRFEFYKRNGFTDNPFPHFHPPYRPGFTPHELIVLSHGNTLNQAQYEQFRDDLENIVMK